MLIVLVVVIMIQVMIVSLLGAVVPLVIVDIYTKTHVAKLLIMAIICITHWVVVEFALLLV